MCLHLSMISLDNISIISIIKKERYLLYTSYMYLISIFLIWSHSMVDKIMIILDISMLKKRFLFQGHAVNKKENGHGRF